MTISAKIIADSISEEYIQLTTFQLRYPRFIHAELMTHRVFSRNASSSRAIPVERLIKDVMEDTAMPLHWGKNQPGMQAKEEHDETVTLYNYEYLKGSRLKIGTSYMGRLNAWMRARDYAISVAEAFNEAGYHKQIVNRLLEPFSHINVVVTTTELDNFFTLRDHPDAQPEIMVLAQEMKRALTESTPNLLKPGEWHLPYISKEEINFADVWKKEPYPFDTYEVMKRCSVARCARVSYLTHDAKPPIIKNDLKLYDQLITSKPSHASPCEHQATPDWKNVPDGTFWMNEPRWGNFKGWQQYRKLLGM